MADDQVKISVDNSLNLKNIVHHNVEIENRKYKQSMQDLMNRSAVQSGIRNGHRYGYQARFACFPQFRYT